VVKFGLNNGGVDDSGCFKVRTDSKIGECGNSKSRKKSVAEHPGHW